MPFPRLLCSIVFAACAAPACAEDLSKMMPADAQRRMREANRRESKAFAEVATKEHWEKYRDARLRSLRESLGPFPDAPKAMRIETTRELVGEGYLIRNLVYESRPGIWVAANLYFPAKPPAKMPGILIAHSHHNGKTNGELQDMGATWARAGAAVLVPDQLGYGERRQHDFRTDQDFDKPYRVGRQDYFFRYNSDLQLSAAGESLMGWMVWDLLRGLDVLLEQPTIDPSKIILMGAVAGGGDPAGAAAALDPRVACVVPFNFGGWQPESKILDDPDRDFAWFGDGYWESTRGLKNGARDGFAHFVIVGSVAPRKVLYAHEFGWDGVVDPAWPRLRTMFGFYRAGDSLRAAYGKGSVKGPGGAENSHCDQIGAVHRAMIYPALKDWFDMPIPAEYSKRRPAADLVCWTDEAKKKWKPMKLHEALAALSEERLGAEKAARDKLAPAEARKSAQQLWAKRLGDVEPVEKPKVTKGSAASEYALETDEGITVPLTLMLPKGAPGRAAVVVMVAQAGRAAFARDRADAIGVLSEAGIAVCLVDVRGTGESQVGTSADRGSSRTSISQTNRMLGQPVLGSQLRDLRTAIRWLSTLDTIDGKKVAVWGDSFAKINATDAKVAVPLDLAGPAVGEPNGANLALLAGLFEDGLAVVARGGLASVGSMFAGPHLAIPHDAVHPVVDLVPEVLRRSGAAVMIDGAVDARNRAVGDKPLSPTAAAKWVAGKLDAW